MSDPSIAEILAGRQQRRFLEDMRRDPGYGTRNLVPVTEDEADAMRAWVEAIEWATHRDAA